MSAAKALKDLFTARRGSDKEENALKLLQSTFNDYNARMRVLSEQLEQTERLTRMVPAWLELSQRMPMWKQASDLDDHEARTVLEELRSFIHESVRDHFSGTFFHMDFAKLPNVPDKLKVFSARPDVPARVVVVVVDPVDRSSVGLLPVLVVQQRPAELAAVRPEVNVGELFLQLFLRQDAFDPTTAVVREILVVPIRATLSNVLEGEIRRMAQLRSPGVSFGFLIFFSSEAS